MNHKSKNSHHGGTSVVKLNSTLLQLGLLVELVPSEINEAIAEVTDELSVSGDILHDEKLKEANEEEDLKGTILGNIEGAGPAISNIGELGSIKGDVSGKVDSGTSDDVSKEGQLADTSVLQLNVTETVEALLAGLIQQSQGIEESKGGLGTEFVLEGSEGEVVPPVWAGAKAAAPAMREAMMADFMVVTVC
ncbi:hypothetical protein ACHAWO_008602 [Cyclotella atomus]|uniref:Uncharacterized protein n=1 Tax=Cyclotella atomus TaxID=382360 RepID=A0ABD3PAY1_9STRA